MEEAKLFKVFSDPNRLEIIQFLAKGVCCSCQFIEHFDISQPTLTYHLKLIRESGLAETEKNGTWRKYKINYDKIDEMIAFLNELKATKNEDCGC
ncbi:MAG: winged helix-turn-helix transcriptional regulator [Bacilli bacterium]|nr:winged helix-turn-helix transcriptional regulator [Bacilli bacterium]